MRHLVEVTSGHPAHGEHLETGPTYRYVTARDAYPKLQGGMETLFDVFTKSVEEYGGNKFLGWRPLPQAPYEWLTYSEAAAHVSSVASALKHAGVTVQSKVGVFGSNCPEWMIAMQACNRMGYVCVPLYETLGASAIQYIIGHAQTAAVFVAAAQLPALLEALEGQPRTWLKTIVYWGKAGQEAVQAAAAIKGVAVHRWLDFRGKGKLQQVAPQPPAAEDPCTIMYTSGTTGTPKGVILTHENVLGLIAALKDRMDLSVVPLDSRDCLVSYLPLAHIFDRVCEEFMISLGASIGYWQGDVKKLMEDLAALKPTFMPGVPRIFERVYDGITTKVAAGSPLKRRIFWGAYAWKRFWLGLGYSYASASPLADRLVFGKIKEALGGRVRVLLSGAAPLSYEVEEFMRVTMCCAAFQGYGLTETTAGIALGIPDDYSQLGTVGPLFASLEARLEAVPEMGYSPSGPVPRGELCVRGRNVFEGYYKEPELSTAAIDADGFFHTGDIAEFTPEGCVRIIDRKKNIFKLSQGEYVAVEVVEGVLRATAIVEQVWVYGSSLESCLVAVVVPNQALLQGWAKTNVMATSMEDICASARTKEWVLEELTQAGRAKGLKGFEIPKAVHLDVDPFSVENGLITPTFKMKRQDLQRHYQARLDGMYAELRQERHG